jgi:hypothetical protein
MRVLAWPEHESVVSTFPKDAQIVRSEHELAEALGVRLTPSL